MYINKILPLDLSIYPVKYPFIHPSIYLSVFINPFTLTPNPSVNQSVHLFIPSFIHLYNPSHINIKQSIPLAIHPSVFLFVFINPFILTQNNPSFHFWVDPSVRTKKMGSLVAKNYGHKQLHFFFFFWKILYSPHPFDV